MKHFYLIFFINVQLANTPQNKKNEKASFEVIGNCEICKKRIEKAALSKQGVKYANWDIPSNLISVIYNSNKISLKNVQAAISSVGHDTPMFKALDSVYNELPMCCLYKRTN